MGLLFRHGVHFGYYEGGPEYTITGFNLLPMTIGLFQFFTPMDEASFRQKHEEQWRHVDYIGSVDVVPAFDEIVREPYFRGDLSADPDRVRLGGRRFVKFRERQLTREHPGFDVERAGETVHSVFSSRFAFIRLVFQTLDRAHSYSGNPFKIGP